MFKAGSTTSFERCNFSRFLGRECLVLHALALCCHKAVDPEMCRNGSCLVSFLSPVNCSLRSCHVSQPQGWSINSHEFLWNGVVLMCKWQKKNGHTLCFSIHYLIHRHDSWRQKRRVSATEEQCVCHQHAYSVKSLCGNVKTISCSKERNNQTALLVK